MPRTGPGGRGARWKRATARERNRVGLPAGPFAMRLDVPVAVRLRGEHAAVRWHRLNRRLPWAQCRDDRPDEGHQLLQVSPYWPHA